jgi:hypothetical protein
MQRSMRSVFGVVAVSVLAACGGPLEGAELVDSGLVSGADETLASSADALTGAYPVGSVLSTTTGLNLRSGPGTNHSSLRVMPGGSRVTTVDENPAGGWYHLRYDGLSGWASGNYLTLVSRGSAPSAPTAPGARDQALARARSGVGFSYWWGHGRWLPGQLNGSTAGSCVGSCPSCTHAGRAGADCSGYVGKVWQVGTNGGDVTVDGHPYATGNFQNESHGWSRTSRGAMHAADALVYNANGAGHIFLYESGDAWGSMWAYEAKGCVAGIVHDLRTASSAYVALARNGY